MNPTFKPPRIIGVKPTSEASRLGIKKNYRLSAVNEREVTDQLDFRFHACEGIYSITVVETSGEQIKYYLDGIEPDELGIELEPLKPMRCKNKCIFCFCDQNHPKARKSLRFKDEDYRYSFLEGNFVTLSHITDAQLDKIIEHRLSPLYISVHAIDKALRDMMLGIPSPRDIKEVIDLLASGNIKMHTQIVLCPGINDGQHLVETIEWLAQRFPQVRSIGIVPVGLTRFRDPKSHIKPVTPLYAKMLVNDIRSLQDSFSASLQNPLVFLSDEWYLQSGIELPPDEHYHDYPQLENGIGMVRSFIEDWKKALPVALRKASTRLAKYILVTGDLFYPILRDLISGMAGNAKQMIEVLPVKNRYLGESVTVAGLLAGQDIADALSSCDYEGIALIPPDAYNLQLNAFIDDMSLRELGSLIGRKVKVASEEPSDLLSEIVG